MSYLSPTELNLVLCRALGLNPDRVAGIVITCKPNEAPTVEVTQFVLDSEGKKLGTELKRCELVPRPEGHQ